MKEALAEAITARDEAIVVRDIRNHIDRQEKVMETIITVKEEAIALRDCCYVGCVKLWNNERIFYILHGNC